MSTSSEPSPDQQLQSDNAADRPTTLKRARRAWSIWSWGNRLWAFVKTKLGVATVASGMGVLAGGTAVLAPDLIMGRPPAKRIGLAPVNPERLADASTVYTIDGVDKDGRRATFEMLVVARAFTWLRGSATELAKNGEVLAATAVGHDVFAPELRQRLALSGDLIAAGAASVEGALEAETVRAGERARTAAGWLAAAAPGKTIWTLNLGQYQSTCEVKLDETDTAWQRPLIIFGVRRKDEGVKLDEALADAMTGRTNVPSPSCYSSFTLTARG